jgi:hypothetical protein
LPFYVFRGMPVAWLLGVLIDARKVCRRSGHANAAESSLQRWTRGYAYLTCFAQVLGAGILILLENKAY